MSLTAPIIGFDIKRDDHAAQWSFAFPRLKAAIKRLKGTHEPIDVLTMLHTGHGMLWHGDKASAITEILLYPRKKVCDVFLAGGRGGLEELVEWTKPDGILEEWAFHRWNCDRISYTGRRGWGKMIQCEVAGELAMREKP